jgi:hypothetical protein
VCQQLRNKSIRTALICRPFGTVLQSLHARKIPLQRLRSQVWHWHEPLSCTARHHAAIHKELAQHCMLCAFIDRPLLTVLPLQTQLLQPQPPSPLPPHTPLYPTHV